MKAAKGIWEICRECEGFDAVVTSDPGLAEAVRRRVRGIRVETPDSVAMGVASRRGILPLDEMGQAKAVSESCGTGFADTERTLSRIRSLERFTADPCARLQKNEIALYRAWSRLPTKEGILRSLNPAELPYNGLKTAVIGLDLFDDISKHCIPDEFTEIDFFSTAEWTRPEPSRFGSPAEMAKHVASSINPGEEWRYAVVCDSESSGALESALALKGLRYSPLHATVPQGLSAFIRFVELSKSYRSLRIRDVRSVFTAFGAPLPKRSGNWYVSRLLPEHSSPGIDRLRGLMESCGSMTLGRLAAELGASEDVTALLESSGLSASSFGASSARDLNAAAKLFCKIEDSGNAKVKIVDARRPATVDRQIVFFMGDADRPDDAPPGCIDRQQFREDQEAGRCLLLQQGGKQVRIALGDSPADLADTRLKRDGKAVRGSFLVERPLKTPRLSKSSFEIATACPLKFMLSGLIRPDELENNRLGSEIHRLAFLMGTGQEASIDEAVERMSEIAAPSSLAWYRGRLESGVRNVKTVLEGRAGVECEKTVYCGNPKLMGIFDLQDGKEVIDYKTGRSHTAATIAANMFGTGRVYVQPLFYIAICREALGMDPVFRFAFVGDGDAPHYVDVEVGDVFGADRQRLEGPDYSIVGNKVIVSEKKFGEFLDRLRQAQRDISGWRSTGFPANAKGCGGCAFSTFCTSCGGDADA